MKAEKDKLSALVKQKLADYEKQPPAHVWENIHAQLNTGTATAHSGLVFMFRKHWYVAAALAAAILLLLFVLSFAGDAGVYNQSILPPQSQLSSETTTNNTSSGSQLKIASVSQIYVPGGAVNHHTSTLPEKEENNKTANPFERKEWPPVTRLFSQFPDQLASASKAVSFAQQGQVYGDLIRQLPESEKQQNIYAELPASLSGNNKWAFGVFATPEMLYSPSQTSGGKPSLSADVAVMYKFSNYFLQSGVSLGSSDDNSNANINYLQTEFMGTYQDVYDVTFDTSGDEPQPVYHTQEVEVYDTTQHSTTTLYTNSYRYLSLPLLMGYQQQITEKFSYSIKGGPMVSFMLEESSRFSFNYDNAHIQEIHNMPAGRVTTNWQALVSLGLQYRIHKNIHLAIEPRMKYYFNPVYNTQSQGSNNNPVALGVRTGLVVGF